MKLKLIFLLVGICLLGCSQKAIDSDNLTYTINLDKATGKFFLCSISTIDDSIERKIKLKKDYVDISITTDNVVLLSAASSRDDLWPNRSVDVHYPDKNRVKSYIKTKGQTPLRALSAGEKRYVGLYVTDQYGLNITSVVEVFDKKSFVARLRLNRDDRIEPTGIALTPDKKRLFVAGIYYGSIEKEDSVTLYEIDTNKDEIIRKKNCGNHFACSNGIAVNSNKIYLSALFNKPGPYSEETRVQNRGNSIYIFDRDSLAFIKEISVDYYPETLIYVQSLNRVYVLHRNLPSQNMEVIDCDKDEVIAKIGPIYSPRYANYVGNNKIYISVGPGMFLPGLPKGQEPGILVVDLLQNKIVKQIPGNFGPIAGRE